MTSAEAAVGAVIKMEPKILENDNDDLILEFQQDRAGVKGDVRDIVIRRNDIGWEIGLSIKHNHDAVKHSRLSHKIDFGKEWFGLPCSDDYWDAVKPIFDMLKDKKDRGVRWSDMDDKNEKVYVPLLQAFMDEISDAVTRIKEYIETYHYRYAMEIEKFQETSQIALDDLRENVPGFVAPQMYIYLDNTELLEYIDSNLKVANLQVKHLFERIEACQVCVH